MVTIMNQSSHKKSGKRSNRKQQPRSNYMIDIITKAQRMPHKKRMPEEYRRSMDELRRSVSNAFQQSEKCVEAAIAALDELGDEKASGIIQDILDKMTQVIAFRDDEVFGNENQDVSSSLFVIPVCLVDTRGGSGVYDAQERAIDKSLLEEMSERIKASGLVHRDSVITINPHLYDDDDLPSGEKGWVKWHSAFLGARKAGSRLPPVRGEVTASGYELYYPGFVGMRYLLVSAMLPVGHRGHGMPLNIGLLDEAVSTLNGPYPGDVDDMMPGMLDIINDMERDLSKLVERHLQKDMQALCLPPCQPQSAATFGESLIRKVFLGLCPHMIDGKKGMSAVIHAPDDSGFFVTLRDGAGNEVAARWQCVYSLVELALNEALHMLKHGMNISDIAFDAPLDPDDDYDDDDYGEADEGSGTVIPFDPAKRGNRHLH